MPFKLVRDDLARMEADAVVNTTNSMLQCDGGLGRELFELAGPELQEACNKIGHCDIGQAVVTPAFNLPAEHVIHTVTPIWKDGSKDEPELLRSCYQSVLRLAKELECETLGIPLLGSGSHGIPKELALQIALSEVTAFCLENKMLIYIVFMSEITLMYARRIFDQVEDRIGDQEIAKQYYSPRRLHEAQYEIQQQQFYDTHHPGETLGEMLERLVKESGRTNASVYKEAWVTKQTFSAVKCKPDQRPTKETLLAIGIALHLPPKTMMQFLNKAGYSFGEDERDKIIIRALKRGKFDIMFINDELYDHYQPLLGSKKYIDD